MNKYYHKSGTITLYSSRGTMIIQKRYGSVTARRQIIEQWKAFYRDRMRNSYYHIIPDIKPEKILKAA